MNNPVVSIDSPALAQQAPVQMPNSSSNWLGILGGGQLGRMFVHEAQALGFKVAVLEPEADCPAGHAADKHIRARYDDTRALAELVALCPSITTEFENVPASSLSWLEKHRFVAPSSACVSIAQDRVDEKRFFTECTEQTKITTAPYIVLTPSSDTSAVKGDLLPGILKTARLGYDGKGQVRVKTNEELDQALRDASADVFVLEKMLPLAYEISVLVARGADGLTVVYPIAENVHRDGILFTTTVPSRNVTEEVATQVQHAAQIYISEMAYVGVLCIEFFVLQDGSVVVNEMAPRPHNSGHYTIDACMTSQFAQQVRAMTGLPLGDVRQHSTCVMLNILGDVWFDGEQKKQPEWDKVLAIPSVHLHLYGKAEARVGRKMGHITCVGANAEQLQQDIRSVCQILGIAEPVE